MDKRKVKVLSLPKMIKEKFTLQANALYRKVNSYFTSRLCIERTFTFGVPLNALPALATSVCIIKYFIDSN